MCILELIIENKENFNTGIVNETIFMQDEDIYFFSLLYFEYFVISMEIFASVNLLMQ